MDATTFFLTYPQSSFLHAQVYDFLNTIKPVVWARVATELHEDGNEHIHCIVRFGARVKTRSNIRLFDLDGRHPNIQVTRNVKSVLEYCAKGGNYTDYGTIPGQAADINALYELANGTDRVAFDQCALAQRISFQWANHIWNQARSSNTISEPGAGTECVQLQQLSFTDGSTLVIGPSGCGKSTWAKRVAPKPALWVTHMDDLKKFNNHASIIFDDMSFSHLPREAQIHIVDQNDLRTIHCRHTTATIPANTPKIFTANVYPFLDDEAITRRLRTYVIKNFP